MRVPGFIENVRFQRSKRSRLRPVQKREPFAVALPRDAGGGDIPDRERGAVDYGAWRTSVSVPGWGAGTLWRWPPGQTTSIDSMPVASPRPKVSGRALELR